jgi:prepilin-type N-terminal cleavage/methylation domain-containing protein
VAATVKAMSNVFRQASRQQGFTFNEILVAMAIAGIGVLGYSLSTVSVIRGNRASDNYTVAVNLAQDKLEQLRGRISLNNENYCPAAGESGLNAVGGTGGIFARCWSVGDSSLAANLKQIEVTVTWVDAKPRAVTLATLVYRE